MKIIVTHLSPDFDALSACWLIIRYLPGWTQAEIKYVPAGQTYENKPVDSDSNIIHVDTGLGKFDHHQTNSATCAAKIILDYLIKKNHVPARIIPTLIRFTDFVVDIDHFRYVNYPDPAADYHDFSLYQIIEGLKSVINEKKELENIVFKLLDAQLQILNNKIIAELELKKGFIFQSKWGKAIVLESKNSEVLNLSLKMGFKLAAKKDPQTGNIRIKSFPKLDLTLLHQKIIQIDKKATWFFHVSRSMLLNGSSKNTHFIPSSLSVKRLIELIKSV